MKRLFCLLLTCMLSASIQAQEVVVSSPDGRITVRIDIGKRISCSVALSDTQVLAPSVIGMTVDGNDLGQNARLKEQSVRTIEQTLRPVVRQKSALIEDTFTLLELAFHEQFTLLFRVYNDGVAYRFVTDLKGRVTVDDEQVSFRFNADHAVYFPEEESFFTHQEREYKYLKLSEITPERMCSVPVLVDIENGPLVLITEADLYDYPGMSLRGAGSAAPGFEGVFPRFPLASEAKNDRSVPVTATAAFLAETCGTRSFPWRVMIISEDAAGLIESQMIYKLAQPLQLKQTDWIKPGKVAWDWWNANNVYGVDFKAGINTETYKYYIDFASRYGIEYIILDEGWYTLGDVLDVRPEMDIPELVRYGKEKGVGIILWVVWKTLDDQLEPALKQFSDWDVKGIKVDFMQREDQLMVNYYHKIARKAAEHRLLVDFHGSYKPTGLRRMYPNVMTREGVRGLEHCKWSDDVGPEHDLIIPFIRMAAGPMDYTPGAMLNAAKNNFHPVFSRPSSQGTRCHQLAMYVVYESPLQMLADSPSNYLREHECMRFLAAVPTVWDETRVLQAAVSDYVLIARRSGDTWYAGAMTDWTSRTLELDLSFLGAGTYRAEIWRDGPNADRRAADYHFSETVVSSEDVLTIHMAPGGGWAAIFIPENK